MKKSFLCMFLIASPLIAAEEQEMLPDQATGDKYLYDNVFSISEDSKTCPRNWFDVPYKSLAKSQMLSDFALKATVIILKGNDELNKNSFILRQGEGTQIKDESHEIRYMADITQDKTTMLASSWLGARTYVANPFFKDGKLRACIRTIHKELIGYKSNDSAVDITYIVPELATNEFSSEINIKPGKTKHIELGNDISIKVTFEVDK